MKNKILILGASGMLGHTLFYDFIQNRDYEVKGTVRSLDAVKHHFPSAMVEHFVDLVDANDLNSVKGVIEKFRPTMVINCIGIIKQLPIAKDPLTVIRLNALFPHELAALCKEAGSRLIHVSTDCVFDGKKGNYTEDDKLSAEDLYGISKYMGEVNYEHAVTLRTSIIGHELASKLSLLEWFLSQEGSTKGFTNAIYTGFPTIEISRIIAAYIIPDESLWGLYQVSANPISKYDLLKLVAKIYKKDIEIIPYDAFKDNKSLVSDKFKEKTGYKPPVWEELVSNMYTYYKQFGYKRSL